MRFRAFGQTPITAHLTGARARGAVPATVACCSLLGRRHASLHAGQMRLSRGFGRAEEFLEVDVERVTDSLHSVGAAREQQALSAKPIRHHVGDAFESGRPPPVTTSLGKVVSARISSGTPVSHGRSVFRLATASARGGGSGEGNTMSTFRASKGLPQASQGRPLRWLPSGLGGLFEVDRPRVFLHRLGSAGGSMTSVNG